MRIYRKDWKRPRNPEVVAEFNKSPIADVMHEMLDLAQSEADDRDDCLYLHKIDVDYPSMHSRVILMSRDGHKLAEYYMDGD